MKGKSVVLGVTGGIAAYKACEVTSRLVGLGVDVHVIMTREACNFVGPLTFRTLSRNSVSVDMFDEPEVWEVHHVALAQKADAILVAPATANIIGKVASGIADDMLTTTIMAARCPVLFAPAMNTGMYENPVFQLNIHKLRELGYYFMEPATGALACGEVGKGRFPEPGKIVDWVLGFLERKRDLEGKVVVVTAGPTQEPLDPVRFISNPSSGKMGYALAEAARERGARTILVTGPTALTPPGGVDVIQVQTASEMEREVLGVFDGADFVIMAAAVSDYRVQKIAPQKIKKASEKMVVELVRNPDILEELGKRKSHQVLVGFAAETEDLIQNAQEKLIRKNADLFVANDVSVPGIGFAADTNEVKILDRSGNVEDIPRMSKKELAHRILDRAIPLLRD